MRVQAWAAAGITIPSDRSGEVDTTCPQCSPTRKKRTTRCLSVNAIDGTWCCHHCGWAGSLGGIGAGYGVRLQQPVASRPTRRVYTTPTSLPEDPLPPSVIEWFASRGIPETLLIAAGIRWAGGVMLFPYLRDGRLINVKHRTLDKRFWMVAGAERILYGLDGIAGRNVICIVDGEIDKLSIDTAGGPPTVSVPDGAPPPDAKNYASKFSFLDARVMARLRSASTVLIGTDMDPPGERLAQELARRIGCERCVRVSWSPYKDANELLIARGPAAVLEALAAARPYPVPLDDPVPHGTRPVRLLSPSCGRRPVIDLSAEGMRHAR